LNNVKPRHKMKRTITKFLAGVALIGATAFQAQAGTPVNIELALLVDVSGSVDASEYSLQRQGYIDAFNNPALQSAIAATGNGIAVTYIEWSGQSQQSTQVGWTLITDATSAGAFATAIASTSRAFSGQTAPGSAINFATPLFAQNTYDGLAQVIDISGDGAENEGANTLAAVNAARAGNNIDRINGLVILGETGVQAWYQNNIVTPGGGFLVVANSSADFGTAVLNKLVTEVRNPVPEGGPGMALFGFVLAGLAVLRRKLS
jgi:hypothetical protein